MFFKKQSNNEFLGEVESGEKFSIYFRVPENYEKKYDILDVNIDTVSLNKNIDDNLETLELINELDDMFKED